MERKSQNNFVENTEKSHGVRINEMHADKGCVK